MINGKKCVIEYSDLDGQQMHAQDESGELLFSQGSIAIHIFNVAFLCQRDLRLPYHMARKKVKTLIFGQGKAEVVEKQSVKLEMFIFDLIPEAMESLFYETSRDEEFAPLKNRSGADSIETCIRGQVEKHARQLEECGAKVPRNQQGESVYRIEISPLFALDLPALREKLAGREIEIDGDTLFEEE
jgi:UDP-N-acetylglucosamine/UDP-N-acetylgalactosamine diphosphorylase